MLPAFFGSILELVIKTSTDLAPDVRAAMKAALGDELAGTQSAQALTIIAEQALKRDTGARALRGVIEEIMLDVMYRLPEEGNNGRYIFTKEVALREVDLFSQRARRKESA